MADLSDAANHPAVAKRLLHDVARTKCLRRFNYDPTSYVNDSARERHIEMDTQSTADGPEFRATVADVLRWAAANLTSCPWGETAEHGCDWPLMAERLRGEADEIDPKEATR